MAELLLKELVAEGHAEECEIKRASGRSERAVRGFCIARTAVDDDDDEVEKTTGNETEEE